MYLGIDPGESGGAALVTDTGLIAISPDGSLRCIKFKGKTEHEISDWIQRVARVYNGKVRAVIEAVHSMPKQGVASSFKFGKSYGFLRGLITAHLIPFQEVAPQTWQKDMKCRSKGDKNVTKAAAHKLWPTYSSQISHGLADALLLAEWLRTKHKH